MFSISSAVLDLAALRAAVLDPSCGAIADFEGLVRNHNEGREVKSLEYDAHPMLAEKEGRRIIEETLEKFDISHAPVEEGGKIIGMVSYYRLMLHGLPDLD